MIWTTAEAPSNIALIKYMGKIAGEASGNVSTNSSLSYTLDHLRTRVRVRVEPSDRASFEWRPLHEAGFHAPALSEKGRARFLAHAERCLKRLDVKHDGTFVVESGNGFPSDCGLASSASSFAALTLAVAKFAGRDIESIKERLQLAELSREGSGSSCRSLFTPWALWKGPGAQPVDGLPATGALRHLAVIVDDEKKTVSSSEAHVRVTTSLLFRGRVERAEERLRLLLDQLRRASGEGGVHAWNRAAHLVWAESWDMHALFESSEPPFGYFVPGSVLALNTLRDISQDFKAKYGEAFREPMVTMDAGPNVHVLLWNDERTDEVVAAIHAKMSGSAKIVDSKPSGLLT